MAKLVQVDLPNVAAGTEVEIPGLGVFKNGESREVSAEQAEYFRLHHSRQVDNRPPEDYAKDGVAAISLKLGPTVHQAFKDHPHINEVEPPKPVEEPKKEKASTAKASADKEFK